MWVERVQALGFGPLNSAVLELGEGMTLVFGLNEAGKSSWHGALYAGVCGVRRGRGRRTASDGEFETRYRPWTGGPWRVEAVVALADGRRFELAQDLGTREGTARDQATGRDVTRGILTEQTPDASRWLGLDRDAFRAVACVPQTALLQILEQPALLAGHLQRAAATAGTDATAAEAIRRISEFLADQVGTDRAYTKPLARAKDELRNADAVVQRAEQAHAELAQLREELREASGHEEAADHQLRCAEAADARRRADAAQDTWKQAADLAGRYPEPPPSMGDDDALAQQARVALSEYRSRPTIPVLNGPDFLTLEAELAGLPQSPSGDLQPAEEVETAYELVRQGRARLESVTALEPAAEVGPGQMPADPSEMRLLADALAAPLPSAPPQATSPEERPSPVQPTQTGRMPMVAAAAIILLVAGVAVAVAARQPVGWAAAAAGAIIGVVLIISLVRDRARHIAALKELQAAGPAWALRKAAEERRAESQNRVAVLNLPANPTEIRKLADAADRARAAAQQRADWEERRKSANTKLSQALSQLAAALNQRGMSITSDLEADYQRYRAICAQRTQQAAQAARRDDLQAQLTNRQQAEAQAADASRRRANAKEALRAAAKDCLIPQAETADLDALAAGLETWLKHRLQSLAQRDQAAGDYAVLQNLLEGGKTLEDLHEEADRLVAAADRAAANLDATEIAAANLGPDPVETLQKLRAATQEARDQRTELQTTNQERERSAPGVPASQEAAAQAAQRVAQLEHLSRILSSAREFLTQAQETVHRSIAPQLANAIAPHLATVTGGSYTEVRVDPDDLQVRVRPPDGTWREASRLSYGTAEQVYLLLRAALAEYLATTSEPCPLILDDPTAYADDPRTIAMLEVLHTISTERQVIVFSHDTQALEWARQALRNPRDKIVELTGDFSF